MARDKQQPFKSLSPLEEQSGKLSTQFEKKLMHSVLENDKETLDQGRLIKDCLNQNISSFSPGLMFEQLVQNYQLAKSIYGESLIKLLSGYNPKYVEKNIQIPEFKRELQEKINKRIEDLKDKKLIDKENSLTDKGYQLASLTLYTEELDRLIPKGIIGEKIHKKSSIYGDKQETKSFKKTDRYRDIAVKKSIKLAIRRKHKTLQKQDLKVFERQSKGSVYIVYAIDASGSMKGKKIDMAKKAGIALSFKAIESKDKVGLIVFGTEIKEIIYPTNNFLLLLKQITKIKAQKETNLTETIKKANELFPKKDITKHLILLTDALPTIGKEPEKEVLEACSITANNSTTISLIGINLDKKGEKLAKKITEISNGNLFICKKPDELDRIILKDYYSVI